LNFVDVSLNDDVEILTPSVASPRLCRNRLITPVTVAAIAMQQFKVQILTSQLEESMSELNELKKKLADAKLS
jgi:hypothetical protein